MASGLTKPIILILAISLAVRIGGAVYWQWSIPDGPSSLRFGDSDTYWVHAQRVAAGEPYHYLSNEARIFRAPLFPIFLSPFAYFASNSELNEIDGAVLMVRFVGALLGTFCIWLIWWLTKRIGGDYSANLAALFAALYPGAIGMSIFVLSEMIFCPLMLGSLLCSSKALILKEHARTYYGWILLAGFLTGLACLARPSWGLWAGLFWLMASTRLLAYPTWRQAFTCVLTGVAFIFGITLAMGPWWIRNYHITGKFVPSTLQVGASLYDGWHAGATGSSDEGMAFVDRYLKEQIEEDRNFEALGLPKESTLEWRLDRRLRNAAIQWVLENPSDAVWLGMVKFCKTWRPIPVAKELGSSVVRYAEGLAYVVIMVLGVCGIWSTRWNQGAWLFALPTVYFGVLHMVFIGSVRYRQPAVLCMCVLAGCGIVFLLERIKLLKPEKSELN